VTCGKIADRSRVGVSLLSFEMAAAQINRSFSAFLDLSRILAALVVFLAHFSILPKTGAAWLEPYVIPYQHSAVIVFFVLSGYLISYAAMREGDALTYAVNRAARIYSVVVPALALTWGSALFLSTHDPTNFGDQYQLSQPWKYVPLFLVFATDLWFLAENAFTNVPYWSLSYEVWYYVLFGIVFFGRGRVSWAVAAAIVFVLIGPRLWLLLPVWVLGVGIQVVHRRAPLGRNLARFLLVASLGAIIALKIGHVEDWCNAWYRDSVSMAVDLKLRYSKWFLGDYLFAALTGLAILAAPGADIPGLARVKKPLAAAASISFSLYLVHYPAIQFFSHFFPMRPVTIMALSLGVVAIVGIACERRKDVLRRWLMRPFQAASH
jgi:peptidoglycan/LPS O-acetylase OafA/YrhL